MAPKCMERVKQRGEGGDEYGYCRWPSDKLYPEHEYQLDTIPSDIRNWMRHRAYLVDAWKDSYSEFVQKFSRKEWCGCGLW